MIDHYATLGVPKTASADEIKRAYRKLASQHHPDKGGDVKKFQEIEQAYRVLSDPQQRQQYDNPNPFSQFGSHDADGFTPFNFDTIFDIFGTRFGHQQQRPRHLRMALWVSLADVARGGPRTVSVQTQSGLSAIEIEIPLGINDGDNVQYPGLAPGGHDLIIQYRIHPDKQFERQGPNLFVNQSVDFWTLIMGGESIIKDILGNQFSLTIPPRTQPGTLLRMKGRGLPQRHGAQSGDLLIRVQAHMPENIDPEIIQAIERNRSK